MAKLKHTLYYSTPPSLGQLIADLNTFVEAYPNLSENPRPVLVQAGNNGYATGIVMITIEEEGELSGSSKRTE